MLRRPSTVRAAVAALVALLAGGRPAPAQPPEPRIILPESLRLAPSPAGGGVLSAVAVGNPTQAGAIYAVHVRYPAGAKSFPHAYPDQRIYTVISGTFYAGIGADFDEKKLVAHRPGTLIIMPARVVHYAWARDGEVVVQELGVGPSGTRLQPRR